MTRSVAGRHRTGRLATASVGIAAVAATLVLSGCSAGQVAETSQIVSAVPGGSARIVVPNPTDANSAILVQNVTVAYNGPTGYAAGQNAPIAMRIINQTESPIRVTPGDAALVNDTRRGGTSATPTETPTGGTGSVGTPLGSLAWGGGGAPLIAGSASPARPASPGPTAPGAFELVIPAGSIAILAPGTPGSPRYMQISNLSQAVSPGDTVALNITFNVLGGPGAGDFAASLTAPIAPPLVSVPRVTSSVNEGGD